MIRWAPLLVAGGCSFVLVDEPCPSDGGWARVATGGLHTCGLRRDGTIACWGNEDFGKLDAPSGPFVDLSAGYEHTCALDEAGAVTCWGRNDHGQSDAPGGAFVAVSAGGGHTCALAGDGGASCWGRDDFGQASPAPGTYALVSAGWLHTCLADDAGQLSCAGDDRAGQSTGVPTEPVLALDAAQTHTCALTASGTRCWGEGDDGRLELDVPGATQVAAGSDTSCALDADGAITCAGDDTVGQASPPEGVFLHLDLALGGRHGCAVEQLADSDGWTTMRCWGQDQEGQATPPLPE